ncbi:SxtJ family membrane protein [Magnetospirillum sp. LM-5]|uniref:SxtJ family membrane protein n=1 Tax=Magnetospirillum sp. LM-5 TaxID=2681466 RepID=UPI0020C36F0F|nr:SxtJ family membrane protein [Magnetospirillum sp. LM-5]
MTEVKIGSERSFGLVFAVLFAIIALWPLKDGGDIRLWALGAAAAFLVAALAAPQLLKPLNFLWFKFGMLLHHIVTPLVMGLLFFLTVTPVGLLMRATGKDPMRLKRDPAAASYWIERAPPGPAPETMKNQF